MRGLRGSADTANFIEQHRAEDYEAEDDLLRVALDVGKVHPVLDYGNRERTSERAKHLALAAAEARATDNHSSDYVELIHIAIRRGTALELRGHDHPTEPRKQRACDVGKHQHALHWHAGKARCLRGSVG